MTVHRERSLVNKTNRRTEFRFYWYYDSTCFGQSFCPSSGALSRTSAVVQFMQLGDRVRPVASETCRVVIPIKLELSGSVGFIHKAHRLNFTFHAPSFKIHFTGSDILHNNETKPPSTSISLSSDFTHSNLER